MVNLVKIIGLGLAGVTAILFLREAASKGLGVTAQQSGIGFGTFGASIGSTLGGIGSGIGQLGAGVGSGAASLLNPLFTLRDLVYGPQAGNQPAPTAATQGATPATSAPATSTPATANDKQQTPSFFDSLTGRFGFRQLDTPNRTLTFQGPAPITQRVGGIGGFTVGQPIQQFSFRGLTAAPKVAVTIGDGSRVRNVSQLTASRLQARGFRVL